MKRVLAAVGILLLIIGISVYTLVDMQRSIDKRGYRSGTHPCRAGGGGCGPAKLRAADGGVERHGAEVFALCPPRPPG